MLLNGLMKDTGSFQTHTVSSLAFQSDHILQNSRNTAIHCITVSDVKIIWLLCAAPEGSGHICIWRAFPFSSFKNDFYSKNSFMSLLKDKWSKDEYMNQSLHSMGYEKVKKRLVCLHNEIFEWENLLLGDLYRHLQVCVNTDKPDTQTSVSICCSFRMWKKNPTHCTELMWSVMFTPINSHLWKNKASALLPISCTIYLVDKGIWRK